MDGHDAEQKELLGWRWRRCSVRCGHGDHGVLAHGRESKWELVHGGEYDVERPEAKKGREIRV